MDNPTETPKTYEQQPPTQQQAQQQASQQGYAPYVKQYPPQSGPSPFESIVRSSTFITIVVLGTFFIFIGFLTLSITPELSSDSYKHGITMGYLLANTGMFILSTIIILAAIIRKEMDRYVRIALIFFGAVLVFLWLTALNPVPIMIPAMQGLRY